MHFKCLAVACGVAFGAVAFAAAPPGVTGLETVAHVTSLQAGDQIAGPMALTQSMHVMVSVKLRNEAQLKAFLADPQHAILTPAQFAARYGPSVADADAVAAWLVQQGFTGVVVSPNRTLVSATGTVATVQAAFHTSMVRVQTRDGRAAFANASDVSIPASLHGVNGILGLQTVHVLHPLDAPARVEPASSACSVIETCHFPTEFPVIYGGANLKTARRVSVGIVTVGSLTHTLADLPGCLPRAGDKPCTGGVARGGGHGHGHHSRGCSGRPAAAVSTGGRG